MPDYRQFIAPDKHSSPVAKIARALDPMTSIPGLNKVPNKIHDAATAGIEGGNRALSPAIGAIQEGVEFTTPGLKQLKQKVPIIEDIDRFIRDKPVDAAGIAAASFFSGGAAGGAAAGGAGTGAGAGAAGAAGAGASSPLIAGAAGTTSALSQALPAAAGAGLGAGAASPLVAGAAGTTSALGSGLASLTAGNPGLLASLKAAIAPAQPYIKAGLKAKDIAGNLSNFAGPDLEKEGQRKQALMMAERIRNDQNNPELPNTALERQKRRQLMLDAIMSQPQFMGRGY